MGILLRANVLRARIAGRSGADAIARITYKKPWRFLQHFTLMYFLEPFETNDEVSAPKSGVCLPRAF